MAAARLAESVDADMLVILTGVEKVCTGYGTDAEEPLDILTVSKAKQYIEEGQFEEGTMLPKIEAALEFIGDSAVRSALITKLGEGANLTRGTTIKK